jgi:hypothetical protein
MDLLSARLASMRIEDEPQQPIRPRIRQRKNQPLKDGGDLPPHLRHIVDPKTIYPSFISGETPIHNWKSYVRCLSRNEKTVRTYPKTLETLESKIAFHIRRDRMKKILTEWKRKTIESRTPPPELPKDLFQIEVKVKVKTPEGTVRFEIKAPYQELYEKFFSKGKNVPMKKRIQAFALMGFPMTYLETMLRHHDKMMERKPKIDEMIEKVFNKLKKKD